MTELRRSLFLKILLVFLLGVLLHIAALRYFQHNFLFDDDHRVHRILNMGEYGTLLSHELEYPPQSPSQKRKLQDLAQRLHLEIRLMGPDGEFTSTPDVPTLEWVRKKAVLHAGFPGNEVGRVGDKLAILIQRNDQTPAWRALFLLESENALDQHPQLIVELVAILSLVLFLCFLAVRWLLSPLIEISQGVAEVAGGNLEVQLSPSRSGDELSQLAQSFNSMLEKIRSMLNLRNQLLLDISHEFRSPLTRIKVALELLTLDSDHQIQPHAREARDSITRSLRDLDSMTGELLESARLNTNSGGLRLEPLKIEELLKELVRFNEDSRPGVVFKSQLAPDFQCLADSARLQTALRNLIENALKSSTEATRPVEVSVRLSPSATHPVEANVQRAPHLIIQVQDFGIGISHDELASIFEPFYRVDRSRRKSTGGYGLGLSLTQKIIASHGGKIEVESSPGVGSRFWITLPVEMT